MSSPSAMPLDQLAQHCAQETERYRHKQPFDTTFCYELMRRALANNLSDAFTYVYRIYQGLVFSMVYKHPGFAETGEDAEFFVGAALLNFYRNLRGEKFNRFPTVGHLLSYLRSCVHSEICNYLRSQLSHINVPLDTASEAGASGQIDARLNAADLWAYICRLLPNPRDQQLARCMLVLGMKPREIHAAYPGVWRDEREISVAIFRIRVLLRHDSWLRGLAGMEDRPPDS